MRLPRDLSGDDLARHHITIPRHDPLRIGTLASILTDVAQHAGLSRDQLASQLFGDK
jgi:hypothetical protein